MYITMYLKDCNEVSHISAVVTVRVNNTTVNK